MQPTVRALEKRIAAMENGYDAVCFGTGMAATTAVIMAVCNAGDHVLLSDVVYGGTNRVLKMIFNRFGIETTTVNMADLKAVEAGIRKGKTALVITETPTNPTLKLSDIRAISEICKKHSSKEKAIIHACDNTFLTPYFQRPLDLGADIVIQSTTKYFDGHNQTVGGAVISRNAEIDAKIRFIMKATGTIMAPQVAFTVLQTSKTLSLRMERQTKSAARIAEYLSKHKQVDEIGYPGLKSHPQHELAMRQHINGGHGAMIWFTVKGGFEAGKVFMDNITLWSLGENLGSVESLVTHNASMTHSDMPREERIKVGIYDGLIRLSVGAEDCGDLINALEEALSKVEKFNATGVKPTKAKL